MKYFTADLHLAHPFVANVRGFVNYHDHDNFVINGLNNTFTSDDDELYILGDVSSGSTKSIDEAIVTLKHLNIYRKNLHLVLGNHDGLSKNHSRVKKWLEVFSEVSYRGSTDLNGFNVVLSHFPFQYHFHDLVLDETLSTNAQDPGYAPYAVKDDHRTWLLHGHTHAKTMTEFDNYRELNIGIDAVGSYHPAAKLAFPEDELLAIFRRREVLANFDPEKERQWFEEQLLNSKKE